MKKVVEVFMFVMVMMLSGIFYCASGEGRVVGRFASSQSLSSARSVGSATEAYASCDALDELYMRVPGRGMVTQKDLDEVKGKRIYYSQGLCMIYNRILQVLRKEKRGTVTVEKGLLTIEVESDEGSDYTSMFGMNLFRCRGDWKKDEANLHKQQQLQIEDHDNERCFSDDALAHWAEQTLLHLKGEYDQAELAKCYRGLTGQSDIYMCNNYDGLVVSEVLQNGD